MFSQYFVQVNLVRQIQIWIKPFHYVLKQLLQLEHQIHGEKNHEC